MCMRLNPRGLTPSVKGMNDRCRDDKSQQRLHAHRFMTFFRRVVISTNFATDFESEITFPQYTHFLLDIIFFHPIIYVKYNCLINLMKLYHKVGIFISHKTECYPLFADNTFLCMRLNPMGLTPPMKGMDDRQRGR